jgi:hypothetical protein
MLANPSDEGCPAKPWRSRASFQNLGLGTSFGETRARIGQR